jgi:hypothetical protein
MKLAEALVEKKNLSARISELQTRYIAAAVIEEGSTPDETAEELLVSLKAAFARWENLTVAINLTNNAIQVGDITMMQALAHRDILKTQISNFNSIANSIRQRNSAHNRYFNTTGPKMVVAEGVDAKYFIKLGDDLSKELRELDLQIQAANWAHDLTE